MLAAEQMDILAITETFLCAEIIDSELTRGDYIVFRKDRDRHGGGVMVFVSDSLSAVRRQNLENECELLWITLSSNISKILFGVFY